MRENQSFKNVLVILVTSGLSFFAFPNLTFYQSIPLTCCGIYFINRNQVKLAYLVPILILLFTAILYFRSDIIRLINDTLGLLILLIYFINNLLPQIAISYVCIFLFHSISDMSRNKPSRLHTG